MIEPAHSSEVVIALPLPPESNIRSSTVQRLTNYCTPAPNGLRETPTQYHHCLHDPTNSHYVIYSKHHAQLDITGEVSQATIPISLSSPYLLTMSNHFCCQTFDFVVNNYNINQWLQHLVSNDTTTNAETNGETENPIYGDTLLTSERGQMYHIW